MESNGNQSNGMFHGYSFEYEQDEEEETSKQEDNEEEQESSDMATQPVVNKKQKIQQTEAGN